MVLSILRSHPSLELFSWMSYSAIFFCLNCKMYCLLVWFLYSNIYSVPIMLVHCNIFYTASNFLHHSPCFSSRAITSELRYLIKNIQVAKRKKSDVSTIGETRKKQRIDRFLLPVEWIMTILQPPDESGYLEHPGGCLTGAAVPILP